MSVRTAFPNLFAEAADALGFHVFQRIVEVELNGKKFNQDSLLAIDELQYLEKLVVTRASLSPCNLEKFAGHRPEVELTIAAASQQLQPPLPILAEAPLPQPESNLFSCNATPPKKSIPSLR